MNRWVVLFWGIGLSFVLLWTVPEDNSVFRSVSITLIAVLSITYYLYKRYSHNLCIQADLLIAVSALAQFLLPVLFLAFYYDRYPFLDAYGYHRGYAITSCAALLGQTMFFMGYETINKSVYFSQNKSPRMSFSYLFVIFLALLLLVWLSRYILLSSGSYYHIFQSDFIFINPSASALSLINNMGEVPLIAFFVIAFSETNYKTKWKKFGLPIVVFAIEILWYLSAGRTTEVAIVILCPIFAYIWVNKKISKKQLIIVVMAIFCVLLLLRGYRYYVTADMFSVNEVSVSPVAGALLEESKKINMIKVASVIDRLYDANSLDYLLMHYADDYDFELGANYKKFLFLFIPRTIWPDKPVFTTCFTYYYKNLAAGMMPITFWGESYVNFSWVGIIVLSYLLGILMKGYDSVFIAHARNPVWTYFYLYGAIWTMRNIPMHSAVSGISFLSKIIVFAFIFGSIHIVFRNIKKGEWVSDRR